MVPVIFRPERVEPRMQTGLIGNGTVELTSNGVRLVGTQPRTTTANVIAGTVGLAVTFFALLFAMSALDTYIRGRNSMKLFVAIGLVVLVGVFALVRWAALKFLPVASFDRTIPFVDVTGARLTGDVVELSTNAPGFTGVTAFTASQDPTWIVDAVLAAKRGAMPSYRG